MYTAESTVEVSGSVLKAYVDNLRSDIFLPRLQKAGYLNIREDGWYQLQPLFDILNEIQEEDDATSAFVALGIAIAEDSIFPPELATPTIEQILLGWDAHYQYNHQGGTIGNVETRVIDDTHYQLIFPPQYIYPTELAYGLAHGFCRRFMPADVTWTVAFDEELNPYRGTDTVIVNVQWQPTDEQN